MSAWLQHVIALHLDPVNGSPYWLERERELGFSLRDALRSEADLPRLGPFDLNALRTRPYTDFVPRSVLAGGEPLVFGETGGATGVPASVAYTETDFDAAFVRPFLDCVDTDAVFDGGHWLWLGPGGPHPIGKAAQRIARITSGSDAFSIDFDPRWFRRLTPGSIGRNRYLEHVLDQASRIAAQQDIRYVFCTPVVLSALLERISDMRRKAIRFVYLGGMAIDPADLAQFSDALPRAEFLCGYGNTLFGVTHELAPHRAPAANRCYYPATKRLLLRVVPPPAAGHTAGSRLEETVAYGERGQLVMSRLDPSGFLPNVMERDDTTRLEPPAPGSADGIGDPGPPAHCELKIDNGIY